MSIKNHSVASGLLAVGICVFAAVAVAVALALNQDGLAGPSVSETIYPSRDLTSGESRDSDRPVDWGSVGPKR